MSSLHEMEAYIKNTYTKDAVSIVGVGTSSIDISICNPAANLTYIFEDLHNKYGAFASFARNGVYTVTLPEKVVDDRGNAAANKEMPFDDKGDTDAAPRSLVSILLAVAIVIVVLVVLWKLVLVIVSNWHLIAEEINKDSLRPQTTSNAPPRTGL